MPNDKTTAFNTIKAIRSNLNESYTAEQRLSDELDAIETWIKTFSIQVGTLSSNGTGNTGAPVTSINTNGGTLE